LTKKKNYQGETGAKVMTESGEKIAGRVSGRLKKELILAGGRKKGDAKGEGQVKKLAMCPD